MSEISQNIIPFLFAKVKSQTFLHNVVQIPKDTDRITVFDTYGFFCVCVNSEHSRNKFKPENYEFVKYNKLYVSSKRMPFTFGWNNPLLKIPKRQSRN